jgi:Arc/MetJ-type ribon-helix-helix transcriptional regulator
VVLSDITQTPGYRQQMNLMLMDMVSKLPPEYQAAMIEMVIETSDLSNREEVLAQIRKISGSIDEQELSPEEQQAMIAQKEEQEQQKALQFKAMAAEVEGKIAEAKKKVAETAALEANIGIDNATKVEQLNKLKAETKQIIANVVKIRQETVRVIDQDIKQLAPPEPKQVA